MTTAFTRWLVICAVASHALGAVHQWPNPQLDALEALRWNQLGSFGSGFAEFVNPCDQFGFFSSGPGLGGRTNAADWLRTAYHDMANADVHAGTGGLDASIRFDEEKNRPENAGDSFNNTVFFLNGLTSRYVSLSDAIALGAVAAVEQCGSQTIPFRGGRIDAQEPGPPGTPKPEEDLASHTAAFARMGFSATEMIELITCGHTIGGVQSRFFPDIVPASEIDPDTNPDGNSHFESQFALYDNTIAKEYIAGTTQNPLVVGFNVTTRSDMRIFSSDGNVTMNALAASNDHFLATCGSLIERMLNTVPRGVTLTDVVNPLPAKPEQLSLMRDTNGTFLLQGTARFWNLEESDTLQVNLSWADKNGRACSGCSVSMSHGPFDTSTSQPGNNTALWFHLPFEGVVIGGASSVSKFWFDIIQNGEHLKEDQNGSGFPLQTHILAATSTCMHETDGFLNSIRVDIAVKKGLNPSAVWVEGDATDETSGFQAALVTATFPAQYNQTASEMDHDYDIYSVVMSDLAQIDSDRLNVAATINGKNVSDWTTFNGRQTGKDC